MVESVCSAFEGDLLPEHFLSLDMASKLPHALKLAGYGEQVIQPAAVYGAFAVLVNVGTLDSVSLGSLLDTESLCRNADAIFLADATDMSAPGLLLRAAKAKRLLKQCLRSSVDSAVMDQLLDSSTAWEGLQVCAHKTLPWKKIGCA